MRAAAVLARDVMNPELLTVGPEMPVRELAAFLVEKQITGAPVRDDRGRLVGVVSLTDIAEADSERGDPEAEGRPQRSREDFAGMHVVESGPLVKDIMTPTVYTVPDDTPVSSIAQTMISGRVHRLLVTRDGHVVGIVTAMDLLGLLAGPVESPSR